MPRDENPEWTEQDFAAAKTGDGIPPQIRAAFAAKRGRPPGTIKADTKRAITLRLDPDVIEGWRGTGAGWHGRMNDALRAALDSVSR